jgi:hypothetical protein
MERVFVTHTEDLNENTVLTVLNFSELSDELTSLLDENLVSICEGEFSTSSLENVKRRIAELFANKKSKIPGEYSNWEMGAVAELFIHLYIKTIGLRQECMYFNLEDKSAKKGFDGYYSEDSVHWIMESKSGAIRTKGNSHGTKLKEALSDLKEKFTGEGSQNNPWREAYNHASQIDVGSPESIRKYIKSLATEYTNGVFHEPSEFNVIPCSTLYFEEEEFTTSGDISLLAAEVMSDSEYKKGHFICVSSKSVGIFKEYLKETI